MAFSQYAGPTNYISTLDDQPNDVGGLTAEQLKALFDKFGTEFKAWFNTTHLSENNILSANVDRIPKIMQSNLKNLVKNGDFVNGIDGWSFVGSSGSVANEQLQFTAVTQWGYSSTTVNMVNGHAYYLRGDITSISNVTTLSVDNVGAVLHDGSGKKTLKNVFTWPNATGNFPLNILDNRASGWTEISADNIMLFDLTAAFGAGNEPILAEMDAMLQYYPRVLEYSSLKGVYESGSNANGYYIKFDDGTMICKGNIFLPANNYSITIALPATFIIGSYLCVVTNRYTNSLNVVWSIAGESATSFNAYAAINGSTPAVSTDSLYITIGRWK